jgi:hypothetical protein
MIKNLNCFILTHFKHFLFEEFIRIVELLA